MKISDKLAIIIFEGVVERVKEKMEMKGGFIALGSSS